MAEYQKIASIISRICKDNQKRRTCAITCPLQNYCSNIVTDGAKNAEIIEKICFDYEAEHPFRTNREVLKEVFPKYADRLSERCPIAKACEDCGFRVRGHCNFWESEYEGGTSI